MTLVIPKWFEKVNMRNRAKCKLCQSVIESFHTWDHVTCNCGEISVDGGNEYLKCSAKDFKNFLRVDDNDNEIIVTVKEEPIEIPQSEISHKPSRKELLSMFDEMITSYENLPKHAMLSPVSNADLCSSLILINAILNAE